MHQLRTRYGCTLAWAPPPELAATMAGLIVRSVFVPKAAPAGVTAGTADAGLLVVAVDEASTAWVCAGASLGCRVTDSSPPA